MASRPPKGPEVQQGKSSGAPMVTFVRRTKSGRNVDYSREDLDREIASGELKNYLVDIPPTPDNQPMDPSISQRVEEQYVSNSLFSGGHNSATHAHLMDKVIDSDTSHPQMAGAKGSVCAIPGCDGKVTSDERCEDILPCECDFKICRDCYIDAVKTDGICPGCKELYLATDLHENKVENGKQESNLPSVVGSKTERLLSPKLERRMSMNSPKSPLTRKQSGDFDHTRWLFETSGTYGYESAIWPRDGGLGNDRNDGASGEPKDLLNKPWRPPHSQIQNTCCSTQPI